MEAIDANDSDDWSVLDAGSSLVATGELAGCQAAEDRPAPIRAWCMRHGAGVGIGMDELAIGFSIGLTRLPVTSVIAAIALQAFTAAQLGLTTGAYLTAEQLTR